MALIYLLHNFIKVDARNELIKSSNPPWILLHRSSTAPAHGTLLRRQPCTPAFL